jgi:hypothetical protein
MANLVISGDTSGSVTLAAPAVSGTTVLTLPTTSGTIVTTGSAASLTTSGNLTFTGTGNRITGDFSNATAANRVSIQSSTTDGSTAVNLIPNGTSVTSSLIAFANSTLTNASFGQLRAEGSVDVRLVSSFLGSGTYLPLTMHTGGAERLRIDTSGNVGIGITPASTVILDVKEPDAGQDAISRLTPGTGNSVQIRAIAQADSTTSAMSFYTVAGSASNERMRIDSSGNVGIGTTNPASISSGYGTLTINGSNGGGLAFQQAGTSRGFIYADSLGLQYNSPSTNPQIWYTNGAERMRITSAGNVLIGTTSTGPVNANAITLEPTNSYMRVAHSGTGNGTAYIQFDYNGSSIGSVTQATTSTVAFNTSSDYRLKENIAPMTGALATVQALKPVTYKWKLDGSDGQGFIAHELQAVVPDCVTGEKDAVDEEGNPVYQGIDTSFLVATLTAAIQELNAKVTALEAQLGAK